MSKHIIEIRTQLELEGLTPGTEKFEAVFLERKVAKCQELRGCPSCSQCLVVETCPLFKEYLEKVVYKSGGRS